MPAKFVGKALIMSLRKKSVFVVRMSSISLGLILTLWYSKLMGLEIRSFLSFVLISNAFVAYLILSGISFRIRNSSNYQEAKALVGTYLLLSIFGSLLTILIEQLVILLFSHVTDIGIPNNAKLMVLLYSLFTTFSIVSLELLSCFNSLRSLVVIEFMVGVMQISIFGLLVWKGGFSLFVTVLITYSFSYSLCIFAATILLLRKGFIFRASLTALREFFSRETLIWQIRFTVLNLVQRFDKVLIPFFYPSPLLAQITTFASLLGIFRFIPESEMRLLTNRNLHKGKNKYDPVLSRKLLIFLFVVAFVVSLFAIHVFLGAAWVLPVSLALLVATYELILWQLHRTLASPTRAVIRLPSGALLLFGASSLLLLPFLMSLFEFTWVLSIMILALTIFYFKLVKSKVV